MNQNKIERNQKEINNDLPLEFNNEKVYLNFLWDI